MEFDWTLLARLGFLLFGAGFLYLQVRHRPRATKEILSSDDLQQRISSNRYTLVQLFAPL
jgi:hypothetical protein